MIRSGPASNSARRGSAAPRGSAKTAAAGAAPTAEMRVVILHGPERFLIEMHSRTLERALEEAHGGVEIVRYEGAQAAIADILDDLHTLCFLSPHKLVIVDDADRLLAARDDEGEPTGKGRRTKTPRELLERYADDPLDASTLLLRADSWRPGRLDKKSSVFKCETPDDAGAQRWCVDRTKNTHGCTLDADAAALLVERLGTGLVRLDSELGKLASFCAEARRIDRAAVASMVGVGREEKVWALQDPILAGRPDAVIRQLHELIEISGQPDVLIAWAVTDLLRKLAAAAQMLQRGAAPPAVRSELKLFGPSAARIIEVAQRVPATRLVALLHEALETDRKSKSGIGRADRNLEVLALRIVDTIRR